MILDMTTELICILFFVLSFVSYYIYQKKRWKFKFWIIPIFILYFLYLVKITLFPIFIFDIDTLNQIRADVGKYFVFYQLKPFAYIKNYFNGDAVIQLIGNLFLLSPLVCYVEIVTYGKMKLKKEILLLSSASVVIELLQLIISIVTGHPSRVADVDDLILNSAGVIITILLLRFIEQNKEIRILTKKILHN